MMRFKKLLIVILLVMSANHAVFAGLPVHFTSVRPTLTSCEYAGKVSIDGVTAVSGEDEVAVFVKNDFGAEIPVGAAVMGESNAGPEYYFISIYADDATTPEKDGAANGEKLIFKFWDKSEDKEYVIPPAAPYMTYEADEEVFLTPPAVPPVWTDKNINPSGLLNFAMPLIPGDTDGSGIVDIKDGVLSLQVAVGMNSGIVIYRDADCNGDGRIGMEDALYVLQAVAE